MPFFKKTVGLYIGTRSIQIAEVQVVAGTRIQLLNFIHTDIFEQEQATAENKEDLTMAYTPGVAEPCLEIEKKPELSYEYTRRHNLVAVVTDGTAVLGLGDIGPEAGMPVMEGKCVLFKTFGGVDAFPICIRSKDVDEIVKNRDYDIRLIRRYKPGRHICPPLF